GPVRPSPHRHRRRVPASPPVPAGTGGEGLVGTLFARAHRAGRADECLQLLNLIAQAIRHIAGDEPFVIVGYSSRRSAGHVAAGLLEAAGIRPDAVVLLDPSPPGDKLIVELWPEVLRRMAVLQEQGSTASEAWLIATAAHISLFDGWRPQPIQTPTLLLK